MYGMYVKKPGLTPHIGFLNNLELAQHLTRLPLEGKVAFAKQMTDEV